jgi:hypothetical protein
MPEKEHVTGTESGNLGGWMSTIHRRRDQVAAANIRDEEATSIPTRGIENGAMQRAPGATTGSRMNGIRERLRGIEIGSVMIESGQGMWLTWAVSKTGWEAADTR